jgi:hypothetical protein
MNTAVMYIEYGILLILLLAGTAAARIASRLMSATTEKELHDRTRSLCKWAVCLTLLAAAALAAQLLRTAAAPTAMGAERIVLRLSMTSASALLTGIPALRRIRKLIKRTKQRSLRPPMVAQSRLGGHPALVAPFFCAALLSITALVIQLPGASPLRWTDAALLGALPAACGLVWLFFSTRSMTAFALAYAVPGTEPERRGPGSAASPVRPAGRERAHPAAVSAEAEPCPDDEAQAVTS